MSRTRSIPDTEVFATIRHMLTHGGEKAVAFQSVAMASKLAAPTLVQRYGSRDAMVRAALMDQWDRLDTAIKVAADATAPSSKGAQAFLKELAELAPDLALLTLDFRDAALRARAENWRAAVEATLGRCLGGGAPGRDAAAMAFAAWQGQLIWSKAGGKGFRMKDAVRRFT